MRLGFGVLRFSARDFWLLTPREFAAAIEAIHGPAFGSGDGPPDHATLVALMRAFPDE